MFKSIVRDSTLSSRVTTQLENILVSNRLQPGDRLPAERDLAVQFGVSRTVVREAVRSLAAKGFLEVRSGSGTIVCKPSAESVSQSITVFLQSGKVDIDHEEVMEVRRLLEVEIAGLAAGRRTNEDLARLDTIMVETRERTDSREHFLACDLAFHSTLAEATHNDLFPLLLKSVGDIMVKVRELGFKVGNAMERAAILHGRILEQVRNRSPNGARQAMREHLDEAEVTLRKAIDKKSRGRVADRP